MSSCHSTRGVRMEFMTIAEMRNMTRLKIGSAMARWFTAQGITYKMGTDGYPVVLKSHVESVLSGIGGHRTGERKRSSPNFEALKKRLQGHGTQAQQ